MNPTSLFDTTTGASNIFRWFGLKTLQVPDGYFAGMARSRLPNRLRPRLADANRRALKHRAAPSQFSQPEPSNHRNEKKGIISANAFTVTDFNGPKNDGLEQMVWRAAKAERITIVAVAAPMAADTVFITVKQELPATFREHIADLAKNDGFEVRFAMISEAQSIIRCSETPSV